MNNIIQTEERELINEFSILSSPVLGGVLLVLVLGLLFNLLGVSIGFSLFSPTKGVLYSLSVGAILWLFFSSIGSMYAGGWVAGYFGIGKPRQNGVFYGILVGSISILVLLALTFSAVGTVVNTSFSGLQYAISTVHSTASGGTTMVNKTLKEVSKISPELTKKVKTAMPGLKPIVDQIKQKASELLPIEDSNSSNAENNAASPEKVKSKVEKLIVEYLDSIGNPENNEIRKKLIGSLAETTGKSEAEIEEKIEEWKEMYAEAKEKAHQATVDISKEVAKKVSQFALLNFFVLASSMVAAIMGSLSGEKKRKEL